MTPSASSLDGALARRLDRLSLVTPRRVASHGQGDRRSRRRGSSVEFADYRPYAEGDDPNRVDWSVYARSDQLFVRVFEEETILNLHLILDVSRSMDWGTPNKFTFARQVAAMLGYVALASATRLSAWGLATSAPTFGPAWGRGRIGAWLNHLDLLVPPDAIPTDPSVPRPPPPDLHRALAGYHGRGAGALVFLSDLLSPTWEAALARLGSTGADITVLHVLAPEELQPHIGGDVQFIDRETGARIPVTLNTDAMRMYAAKVASFRRQVEDTCARRGMRYILLDASISPDHTVFDTLRRRGLLR